VLTLAVTTGPAGRGAFLAFVYGLGIGIPFLFVALAFQRGMSASGFARGTPCWSPASAGRCWSPSACCR
jgi:cytochrome c-type biogenesis protein